jgi:hypothetical protein
MLRAALGIVLVFASIGVPLAAPQAVRAATNPVVTENAQPGTDQWRIGRSPYRVAEDIGKQIKGYASATSVNKGEAIDLKVSVSPAQAYRIEVFRLGWYDGLGGRLMSTVGPLSGATQAACPMDATTGMIECHWSTSYTLTVPSSWTSGIYLALLTNDEGYQNYIQFVVRDDTRVADLLYQQSVSTYLAYNNYPSDGSTNCGTTVPATGKNLYDVQSAPGNTVVGRPRAVKVSLDRPYACSGADEYLGVDWGWESYFVRWLERSGYDVAYSTNLDTHAHGARLLNYKGFLSVGHDEYWSKEMFDSAEAARDAGVNLAFFGANDVYWQVRFEPSSSGVPNRVMVSYKNTPSNSYSTLDPHPDPALRTVRFRDPPVNRPEQGLMGVTFWSSTARSTKNTAFRVQNSDHWIYAGTGLVDGSTVPGIVGYEADAYNCHYPLPQHTSYTLLSSSPLQDVDDLTKNMNAALYRSPSGAWVFAAGTMSWSWALDDKIDPADPERLRNLRDPRIDRMTRNLLDVFVGAATAPDVGSEVPPCTYDKQLTFEEGQLTGTTGANRTIGTVNLETAAPLAGNYSVSIPDVPSAYVDDLVTPVDDLTVSMSVQLRSRPLVDVRLLVASNLVADVGNLVLRANANGTTTLQLRNGNVRVGSDSPPLAVGTVYQVQLRQKRGSGSGAVLEGFVAPAGTSIGAPFAQTVTGTWTTRADRVRAGSTTNSATTPPRLNAILDDIRIHGGPAEISTDVPYPPSNLTATAVAATQVDLAWTDTATDEASFRLERSTDGTVWTAVAASLPANTTSYSDTGASPSTSYQYRINASNVNGTSAWSNTASATTSGIPPGAPAGLSATQVSSSRIDLAWTDTATSETGFVLERASDSTFAGATSIALPPNATTYSDTGLADGVHWYRVRAVNDTSASAWAGPVRGSRIKDMSFEAGSLTGSSGATKVATAATVGLETGAPLKGAWSARIPMGTAAAYLEETFSPTSELFASFYLRRGAPGTADVRIAQVVHGSGGGAVTAGSLLLRANGTIQLRNYNTVIGTGPVLASGTVYRLALHQRMLEGGNLQLEAYLAEGDASFGAPFASTTTATIATTTGAGTFRVGATGSAGGLDATLDEVSVDTAFMPLPR